MENDPLEINKLPDVIKDAQNEISTLDVLVCGKCHDTFHFVEQFQEHQGAASNCKGISQLKDVKKCESKPQTWGFLLWKHMHVKKTETDASLSPWLLYQKWCKISEEHKNSWIAAGQNLLFVNKIMAGKVQELKATVKNKLAKVNALDHSLKANDSLEEGEIRPNRVIEKAKKVIDKRPVLKSTQPTATKNGSNPKKALRTCKNDIIVMGMIDKILNRRYNAKTKASEYLIKWADSEDTANTWEPRKNVEMCKALVDEYDQSFDKVKTINTKSNDTLDISTPMEVEEPPTSGRPQRTSKKKALNQVKAWCGDITDENEESEKRKFLSDDDDSSDSFEKKFKMEEDTESSDEEKPPITIRKVGRPPSNSYNGMAKKTNEVTNMVSPQRVVRVTQKQMPNLATGVYLMSKTDGIVKLDSSAPSGSPLLKVGQKIGQTQIKMVQRKEVPTKTPIKAATKYVQKVDGKILTSAPKVGANVMRKNVTQVSVKSARIIENEKHDVFGTKVLEDEDSDGLEELAFPTDLPLPVPDSPPREFTLCPLTGKVLGQNDEPEETLPENASLDTLVQLAVMDSPPELDDIKDGKTLKTEVPSTICTIPLLVPKMEESKIHTMTDIEMDIRHSEISKTSQVRMMASAPASITTTTKAPLLNKVLSTPKPPSLTPRMEYPKKLLSTPTHMRPKVTTPAVTTTKPLINRPIPSTTIIHKVASSRHKGSLPKPSPHDPVLKRTTNVTTYKPANRRIPNTITPSKPIVKPTISKVVVPTPPPPPPVIQAPIPIMSMPLLTTDEEQPTISDVVAPLAEIEEPVDETANEDLGELSTYNMLESENPILITGEDGTIYQVAGHNEDGQTILISEDADGHQQCVIVASDNLIMDTSDSPAGDEVETVESAYVDEAEAEGGDDNEPSQVVAQIVNAEPPSPGGTRKVVLLLPDGNLVKTEVSAEQYASI